MKQLDKYVKAKDQGKCLFEPSEQTDCVLYDQELCAGECENIFLCEFVSVQVVGMAQLLIPEFGPP